VESHLVDLGDIFEGISLLFDDNSSMVVDTFTSSLEIDIDEFSPSLDLSHFLVVFYHDYVVDYSCLETPTQSSETSIWRLPSSF